MAEEIWIMAEREVDHVAPVTGQLITKARAIAGDKRVVVVLFERPDQDLEAVLNGFGPDKILVAKDATFDQPTDVMLASALADLVKAHKPNTLLFGATPLGRSVAPRVQAKLQTGLTADCLDLYFEDNLLVQVKPSYGDNVMCEIICPDTWPQMASVRPNTFAAQQVEGAHAEIVPVDVTITALPGAKVVRQALKVSTATGINGANKVLAIGRGAETDALIASTRRIAEALGASVGVTRPLTDRPDFTVEQQIGQSGSTIAPEFLLNLGVSGAVQYQVGITQSKLIVSVNRDGKAPIFEQSDYVFVGDTKAFIDALSSRIS